MEVHELCKWLEKHFEGMDLKYVDLLERNSVWCLLKEVLKRHEVKLVRIPGHNNPSQLFVFLLDAATHPGDSHLS